MPSVWEANKATRPIWIDAIETPLISVAISMAWNIPISIESLLDPIRLPITGIEILVSTQDIVAVFPHDDKMMTR